MVALYNICEFKLFHFAEILLDLFAFDTCLIILLT